MRTVALLACMYVDQRTAVPAITDHPTPDSTPPHTRREEGKLLAIRQLIREGLRPPVLVFLQSKDRARELFHELVYDGVRVDVLHAERTQEQRDAVVRRFRAGEVGVVGCLVWWFGWGRQVETSEFAWGRSV